MQIKSYGCTLNPQKCHFSSLSMLKIRSCLTRTSTSSSSLTELKNSWIYSRTVSMDAPCGCMTRKAVASETKWTSEVLKSALGRFFSTTEDVSLRSSTDWDVERAFAILVRSRSSFTFESRTDSSSSAIFDSFCFSLLLISINLRWRFRIVSWRTLICFSLRSASILCCSDSILISRERERVDRESS